MRFRYNYILTEWVSKPPSTQRQMSPLLHERAFAALKAALMTPSILSIPTADGPFILDIDASDGAVAGDLVQVQDGVEKVIAYGGATEVLHDSQEAAGHLPLHSVISDIPVW